MQSMFNRITVNFEKTQTDTTIESNIFHTLSLHRALKQSDIRIKQLEQITCIHSALLKVDLSKSVYNNPPNF